MPRVRAPLPAAQMSTQARAEIVYVPTVDGLRGLAVVWIVLFHCLAAVGNLAPLDHGPLRKFQLSGYFGVDLLFIITGFVLFLPTVLDGGAVGDRRYFFKRRWARIVPAFWVATVLSYLVSRSLFRPKGGTGAWLSHLTFTHQFAHPVDEIGFGVNGAMWTMSVEVVFYLLLPWVAGWYFRHPFAGLALAVVSSHAWHTVTVNSAALLNWANVSWAGGKDAPYRMAYAPPSYIAHFALGMTGAWLYVKMREGPVERRTRSLASALALASFIGVLAIAVLRGWEQDDHPGGPFDMWVKTLDRTVLLAVLLVAMALASSRAQWVAGNGFSRLLGTVSYGTYLSHLPLILLLKQAFGIEYETKNNGDVYVLMATAVPLSIAVGVVSYTYLEEPFRRWARRRRTSTREPIARRRAALAGAQQW